MVRKQVEKLMQSRNHVNTQRIMADAMTVDRLQRNVGVQSHQPCEEMPSRGKTAYLCPGIWKQLGIPSTMRPSQDRQDGLIYSICVNEPHRRASCMIEPHCAVLKYVFQRYVDRSIEGIQ